MNMPHRVWTWLFVVAACLVPGSLGAQTLTVGVREYTAGNPPCTQKIILHVIDVDGNDTTYEILGGVGTITMPAIAAADKRVTLKFYRLNGNNYRTVEGILGAYTGLQKFDIVLKSTPEARLPEQVEPCEVVCCESRRCGLFGGRIFRGRCR